MNKKKKGFTIVELVVVIAVIGILSAILIPTFSGLIRRSQEQGQQLELRNAYEAYAIEAGEDVLTEHQVVLAKENTLANTAGNADTDTLAKLWKLYEGEDKAQLGSWVHVGTDDFAFVDDGETDPANHKLALVADKDYNGYYVYKYVAAE